MLCSTTMEQVTRCYLHVLEEYHSLLRSLSREENPINARRKQFGHGHTLLQELKHFPALFRKYMRLDRERFEYVLSVVGPAIQKNGNISTSIPPEQRLAITLRHLGDGETVSALSFSYRIGESTCYEIVKTTVTAIVHNMLHLLVPEPNTADHWNHVRKCFLSKFGLPNCLGAIDGRLFRVHEPKENSQAFYCYKHFYAIVMMALVASDLSFLMVDIGAEGSMSDSTVLRRSMFWKRVENNQLNIPEPAFLPGTDQRFPHYFIGDGGFRLSENLMKPFRECNNAEERNYNYLLCRARVVAEHAFGVLVSRWRIFQIALDGNSPHTDLKIMACVCLHNLIIRTTSKSAVTDYVDLSDQQDDKVTPLWSQHMVLRGKDKPVQLRNVLKTYLNSAPHLQYLLSERLM